MKIGMNEIHEALQEVATQKLKRSLNREGFSVETNHEVFVDSKKMKLDLFATKDNEQPRIYEIKVGKNKVSKSQLENLQSVAKFLQARLFITYLEVPKTKIIEYKNIDEVIFEHLRNNIPSEIDMLSTHTTIDSVESVDITSIVIDDRKARIEGNATLFVGLQYGSSSDIKDGNGDESTDSFEFFFRISIEDEEIINAYFKFDLEHFYE